MGQWSVKISESKTNFAGARGEDKGMVAYNKIRHFKLLNDAPPFSKIVYQLESPCLVLLNVSEICYTVVNMLLKYLLCFRGKK